MTNPTLINLPPPPSTPSDFGPGTPNSFTSTIALKDGVQGSGPPHHTAQNTSNASSPSSTTLDAERADRISRLAGLERVATLRGASQHLAQGQVLQPVVQSSGYFDSSSTVPRSTVGSASASGSVGGKRTWASESADDNQEDTDKMSESGDGVSDAGMSDEADASLVGFGEAASNMSGPTSQSGLGKGGMIIGIGSEAKVHSTHEALSGGMEGVLGSIRSDHAETESKNVGEVECRISLEVERPQRRR